MYKIRGKYIDQIITLAEQDAEYFDESALIAEFPTDWDYRQYKARKKLEDLKYQKELEQWSQSKIL